MGILDADVGAAAIAFLSGAAALTLFIGLYARAYSKNLRKVQRGVGRGDWLFSGFCEVIYGAVFGKADPDVVAMKFGVDVEDHLKNCAVSGTDPGIKQMAVRRLLGIAAAAGGLAASFFFGSYIFLFAGLGAFALLFMLDRMRAQSEARAKKAQMTEDLPRFLDLLQPELEAGVPVENAISLICSHLDTLITREFRMAMNDVELGAGSWTEMIGRVAEKYDVESLSSFVLAVSSAYDKGVSITETVTREVKETRESYLLYKKEQAGKVQNTVMIPVMCLQMLPLVAFFILPSVVMLMADL